MNRHRSLACVGLVLLFVGCTVKDELPRGIVRGRVTLDGKPVPGATVAFENKAVGVAQAATTDDDGKYEFVTYEKIGLPVASYKVTVSSGRFMLPGEEIPRIDAAAPTPPKPVTTVPAKYAKVDTSGLSADVNEGNNASFDFDLKP